MKRARRELEAKASEARGLSEEFIKVTDGRTDGHTDRQTELLSELKIHMIHARCASV